MRDRLRRKGIDDIVSTFGTSNPDFLRDESPFGIVRYGMGDGRAKGNMHERLDTHPHTYT